MKFNAILIKSPVGWLSYLRRKKFNYGHRAFPSCIRMFFSLLKVKQSCKKTIFFCSPFSIFPVSSLSSCLLCFHILFIFFQFSFPTFSLWFFFFCCSLQKIFPSIRKSAKVSPEADRHKVLTAKVNIQIIWRAGISCIGQCYKDIFYHHHTNPVFL